jgi:hypothetical protein
MTTANDGNGNVRFPATVLVSSTRDNPCPVARTSLPATVSVPASASKSLYRNASNSERRKPVATGSTRSCSWQNDEALSLGDPYQLAPVRARGGMFEQLCDDLPWTKRPSEF